MSTATTQAARAAARARWDNPANRKAVKIHDLTEPQRGLVLALVDLARAQRVAAARQEAERETTPA